MFQDHGNTIMFADCAMPQTDNGRLYFSEESEIYAPWFVDSFNAAWGGTSTLGRPQPAKAWGMASPTIHFRHAGMANVCWLDGHVTARRMDFSKLGTNAYGADSAAAEVGWFGPDDFSLWDYE
jgi:prepilin-type processing-associated H-X9-DG protein